MSFGRLIGKIEYKDGYVKKSDIFKALDAVEKEEDCEYGDYGSVLSKSYNCEYGEVCDAIDSVEIEDVLPVVHAHWIPHKFVDKSFREYECSNCGKYVYDREYQIKYHKFCLHCGARMNRGE